MIDGKKVTHRYFDSDEYIYMKGQNIWTEDGYCTGPVSSEFWESKNSPWWLIEWKLF